MPDQVELRREALPPLPRLEGEWRRLEAAGRPSFFTSWHWIGALLAALPEARRPTLLRGVARGETVALALIGAATTRGRYGLYRSRGLYLNETGDPRYDAPTIEHNGMLAAAGFETAAYEGLVGWFAGRRGEADALHLRGALARLPEQAIAKWGLYRAEQAVPSYSVELCRLARSDGRPDPALSANARQQLRRAMRHFERSGPLRLVEAAASAQALAFFAALKALHCASWERRGRRHAFAEPFFEQFHRLLIERSFAAGAAQLLEIRAGERIIGYLYNLRLGDRVHAYQSGFDDADRRERPGVVSHALAIRHAYRSGARIYDFMAGRNRLKESFATRCEPMLWQVAQQPSLALHVGRLAGGLSRIGRKIGLARGDAKR